MVFGADGPTIPSLSLQLSAGQASRKRSLSLGDHGAFDRAHAAPSIILTVTSFTRIIIVFHFLRQAMGTQQMPRIRFWPDWHFHDGRYHDAVGSNVNDVALQPYLREEIDYREALSRAEQPVRSFLFKHTREKDCLFSFPYPG